MLDKELKNVNHFQVLEDSGEREWKHEWGDKAKSECRMGDEKKPSIS